MSWRPETEQANVTPCNGCDEVCVECQRYFELFETLYSDAGRALGVIMRFEADGPTYAYALIPEDAVYHTQKRLGAFTTPDGARAAVCRELERDAR